MTPQEAAEQHADRSVGNYRYCSDHRGLKWEIVKCHFLSGQQWQHAQDYQALSSALKEIAELHAKLHEMSEYITKVQSNNDDLEFANSELHAKVNEMKDKLKQHLPEECIERYAEVKFCPIRNGDGWQCKECAND